MTSQSNESNPHLRLFNDDDLYDDRYLCDVIHASKQTQTQIRIMKLLHPVLFHPRMIRPAHLTPRAGPGQWEFNMREISISKFKRDNRELFQKYELEKHGQLPESPDHYQSTCYFNGDCHLDDCLSTKRITKVLKYYQTLSFMSKDTDKQKLVESCHKYKCLLDDYIHILCVHNNESDLEQIFSLLINDCELNHCDITKCTYSLRHFRNRHADKIQRENCQTHDTVEFLFYMDIMDQIHCYLYHLYDTGLRIKRKDIQNYVDDYKSPADSEFVNVCNIIKSKKGKLAQNNNSHRFQQNKFNVIFTQKNKKETHMDRLIEGLWKNSKLSETQICSFIELIQNQEYDSEAIEDDLNDDKNSNIADNDVEAYTTLKNYIYLMKLHEHTFKVGYRFFYWDYYLGTQIISNEWHNNISSCKFNDLCIQIKYKDIKDEILNNQIFTLRECELKISICKTSKYLTTKKIRSSKATPDYGAQLIEHDRNDRLRYGITAGTSITFHHILAVILYCDWSDLCSEFSSTFRKKKFYHSIQFVKEKNREYAHWSRLLRELVEIFGVSWSGQ
eukprot:339562_1